MAMGISHIPRCYGNSAVMVTRVKPQELLCLESCIVAHYYGGSPGL